jgi:hypothetical protein
VCVCVCVRACVCVCVCVRVCRPQHIRYGGKVTLSLRAVRLATLRPTTVFIYFMYMYINYVIYECMYVCTCMLRPN